MAEAFSDREIETIGAWGRWYNNIEIIKMGNDVFFQRCFATITADRKRFEETIDGYTKDWAEQKRKFQKRIEELESRVAFWDRANERQYDKWIQLSRFWQKAENKPNTLPDRMKLLEWLIQHIQEGVESFLGQTATIERLRGALTEIAAYSDETAEAHFWKEGNYAAFDEPSSVQIARKALDAGKE